MWKNRNGERTEFSKTNERHQATDSKAPPITSDCKKEENYRDIIIRLLKKKERQRENSKQPEKKTDYPQRDNTRIFRQLLIRYNESQKTMECVFKVVKKIRLKLEFLVQGKHFSIQRVNKNICREAKTELCHKMCAIRIAKEIALASGCK